jgi:SAM-dependent methyltransferase
MSRRQKPDLADWLVETSPVAAQLIVPLLVGIAEPRSVLDVGCGLGSWLAEFADRGIEIAGVDGFDPGPRLEIPRDRFRVVDLASAPSFPCADLVLCLEVAEHLPESSAAGLVDALTHAAPVVVFSAAVPGQRGIGHVNEQWPSYWRALFEVRGFRQLDLIRPAIWDDDRIPFWYRQNMFVYTSAPELGALSGDAAGCAMPQDVVHPELFRRAARLGDPSNLGIKALLSALPGAAGRTIRRRLG